ncbi:MAG: decarboxylating NADP(+)-dependent phosphogluconate dehydrogenase [Acidimicrobiia bacterium]|nr:MAG: decarboxylating NADP(+)-dependent phosphogluconate dehydrogenase [Acidimicrobiia bacterium]
MTDQADIGLIGLGVMGRNLVLNMDEHGYRVAVFNRTTERVDDFLAGEAAGTKVIGTHSVEDLVAALGRPRKVLLMIPAGKAVEDQIDTLFPMLDRGDIIIDGGNSLHSDTERRVRELAEHDIHYVGMGISGGEEGARHGPSIMPGGSEAAWPLIKDLVQDIAADAEGEACGDWVGGGGAGHFVKMIHNGIEYGDMQVIAEAYDVMRRGLGMAASQMQPVFAKWNEGRLNSFLIEVTARILGVEGEDEVPLVDEILDAAAHKGTGTWTVIASMDESTPTTLVAEAVYARFLSSLVEERAAASGELTGPPSAITEHAADVIDDLEDAVYASKIVSYTQGFMLFDAARETAGWDLDLGTIASLWRAGCIIRSQFLSEITTAYRIRPHVPNLLLDPFFSEAITAAEPGWRRSVTRAVSAGIPVPAYSSALAFYDGYRSERLPANLIQAQRDFFGAHTYERMNRPRGEFFHSSWE